MRSRERHCAAGKTLVSVLMSYLHGQSTEATTILGMNIDEVAQEANSSSGKV